MRGARIALIAALIMLAASPSEAHRISTRSGPPPAGVSISSLTHGQMTVIRDNLRAIRAPFHPPTAMMAVAAFAGIGVAMWGIWPRRSASPLREGTSA